MVQLYYQAQTQMGLTFCAFIMETLLLLFQVKNYVLLQGGGGDDLRFCTPALECTIYLSIYLLSFCLF